MLLNSTAVAESITESDYSKRTQIGIDLSVSKVEKIINGGKVLKNGTEIDPESYVELPTKVVDGIEGWDLFPGAYSLEFNEGVNIPENATGFILQRSSLYRMGNSICSPVWDSGFQTNKMGTTLIVNNHMFVEKNARVAQFFLHENFPVEELYNGQWQNKTNY